MAEESEPTFLVDVSRRPIFVLITGRANFQNCSPLRTFFRRMFDDGVGEFQLDFSDCQGMDSTFLGILAGAAIEARRTEPSGDIQLSGLTERNLELVKSLGLERIVTLIEEAVSEIGSEPGSVQQLALEAQTEKQKKDMLLSAHEDLVKIDKSNESKFQDLLNFLKNED